MYYLFYKTNKVMQSFVKDFLSKEEHGIDFIGVNNDGISLNVLFETKEYQEKFIINEYKGMQLNKTYENYHV